MDFQNSCQSWYFGSLLPLEMTACILNACSHVETAKHVAHLRLWLTHKRWTLRWQVFLFPASVTWALCYVIQRVPTNLQEHLVTHCCKREAIANKVCNCAHASAVNPKGFVELAAAVIEVVIPKLEFHLILQVWWMHSPKWWTWITCTPLTEVEVCNNFM